MSTGGLRFKSYVFEPVVIGTQTWAKTNYDFGGAYPNGDADNVSAYGKLYTWDEAMAINYPGWHLPTSDEWNTLRTYLGGYLIAGGKMKEAGLVHWSSPNTSADNSSGFTAVGAGVNGGFFNLYAEFWTAQEVTPGGPNAYTLFLSYNTAAASYHSYVKTVTASVRLIKDS